MSTIAATPAWLMPSAIGSCLAACVITIWLFLDSGRRGDPATVAKTLAVMAVVLALAGAVVFVPGLASSISTEVLMLLAYVGIAAGASSVVVAGAYLIRRTQAQPYTCPSCLAECDPSWTECPYCGYPEDRLYQGDDAETDAGVDETIGGDSSDEAREPAGQADDKPTMHKTYPDRIAWLTQVTGVHAGREWRLADENYVGRGNDTDVVLDDPRISRRHAKIWLEGDGFVIQDLASGNGTWQNGARIEKKVPLRDQDRLVAGDTEMVFLDVGDLREDARPSSAHEGEETQ